MVRGGRPQGQHPRLILPRKSGVEIVEVKRLQVVASADERMLQLAAQRGRQQISGGKLFANRLPHARRKQTVAARPLLVNAEKAVSRVTSEHFVGALACEDDLYLLRRQL